MKRIVSLLLAVMLLAVVCVSAVPVSAATSISSSANALFRWKYNGKNYAETSRPEIDEVWTDGNNIVNLRFFARKNATDYGYRIYVKTPKQKDWYRIADLPIQACSKDTKTGLICAKATLSQSVLTYIYHTCSVGEIGLDGVNPSSYLGYYPHTYTVRALDKNGKPVGGFRGSMSNGKYVTQPATLTPFKGNRANDDFNTAINDYSSPGFFNRAAGNIYGNVDELDRFDAAFVRKRQTEDPSYNFPIGVRFNVRIPTECKKYAKYIRFYYTNEKGSWTKYADIPVTSANRNVVSINVLYRDVYVKNGCLRVTARALDKDYKWISSFIPWKYTLTYDEYAGHHPAA